MGAPANSPKFATWAPPGTTKSVNVKPASRIKNVLATRFGTPSHVPANVPSLKIARLASPGAIKPVDAKAALKMLNAWAAKFGAPLPAPVSAY